mmetsp:Transcript_148631/g.272969  ORF Transcript_148631/g.272969 Transcript_148631/m.272969 type:complete len:85 (+) Transcript_148631:3-257(+)
MAIRAMRNWLGPCHSQYHELLLELIPWTRFAELILQNANMKAGVVELLINDAYLMQEEHKDKFTEKMIQQRKLAQEDARRFSKE